MGVNPIYEPIELLRDDGIRTYSARESATGRAVLLYVFTGAQPQTAEDLLGQIQTLKDRKIPELIDSGISEGVPFVVTEFEAGVVSLREWVLTQMDRHGVPRPAGNIDHLTRVGRWRVPAAPPALPARPPEAGPMGVASPAPEFSQQPQTGPGEFTRMFQAGTPPAPFGEPVAPPTVPAAAPPVAPVLPPPAPSHSQQSQSGPGEFTRMFQAGTPPAPIGEPVPPPAVPAAAPPVAPVSPPQAPAYSQQSQSGPGEFTRMFQVGTPPAPIGEPVPPPTVPAAAPPVAPVSPPQAPAYLQQPQSGPGEFTRMFQAGSAPVPIGEPAPQARPAPTAPTPEFPKQPQSGPGEFTRYFSSPLPPSASETGIPGLGSAYPASFTPPAPLPAPGPAQPPPSYAPSGEFTRIFGKSELGSMPPAQPVIASPPVPAGSFPSPPAIGGNVPSFTTSPSYAPQSAPIAPPTPASSGGPGEYTRMFGPQSRPTAPAPAPAPVPFPALSQAKAAATKKSMLPLILILSALFLVAVIVVVLFALKK